MPIARAQTAYYANLKLQALLLCSSTVVNAPHAVRQMHNASCSIAQHTCTAEPAAMAAVRKSTATPIASLETIHGRRDMRPYLDHTAVDVAIIDPRWNRLPETMRMASLADTYEVNVAPHNYHGQQLATLIGVHMATALPNFRIMEFVADEPPWVVEFLAHPIEIKDGSLVAPSRPGWGRR